MVEKKNLEKVKEEKVEKKAAVESKPAAKNPAKKKIVFVTGKRKKAVARARFKEGNGRVKINSMPLELIRSDMVRLKIQEPLILAGDTWKKFDINVNIRGGGKTGQTEAARQAIAKGLVQLLGAELKKTYVSYDRNLLVYDPRRTEPHKSPRSSQGPRRYKQRSKR